MWIKGMKESFFFNFFLLYYVTQFNIGTGIPPTPLPTLPPWWVPPPHCQPQFRFSWDSFIGYTILKTHGLRAWCGGAVVKVLALHARDPIWVLVLSRQPPFPSRRAVEDGPKLWDPAPAWETRKRLLASDWHSIGHCAHLESESSLSLPSVYPPFQLKKIIKINLKKKKKKHMDWDQIR